jgi:hypothetical protein
MNFFAEKFVVVGRFFANMAVYMFIGMVFGLFINDVIGLAQGKPHKRMIRVPENSVTQTYLEDLKLQPIRLR